MNWRKREAELARLRKRYKHDKCKLAFPEPGYTQYTGYRP